MVSDLLDCTIVYCVNLFNKTSRSNNNKEIHKIDRMYLKQELNGTKAYEETSKDEKSVV